MLESLNTSVFEYERLKPEEMQKRGILGRLVGIMADTVNPTRNGRSYSSKLWENVFNNPIMKERIENNCCFGELGHPIDREETDMEKIAICMDGLPKKDKDGKLQAVFNILDTPNGRILKTLCDYGCNIGISSRGSGDLVTDFDGNESVDPDTYNCEGWDAVLIPAVKEARLKYVTESLDKKRYNKSLRTKLQEALDKETVDNRKVMSESLSTLGILLEANEDEPEAGPKPDEQFINDMDKLKQEEEPEVEEKEETFEVEEEPKEKSDNFVYKNIEVIKDPESGKFVCEIDGDSYSFNTEKNARIWIDINTKDKKPVLKEEQVGRDETKDDKNVDDVLTPDSSNNKEISNTKETTTQSEDQNKEEDKEEEKDKITISINESACTRLADTDAQEKSIKKIEKIAKSMGINLTPGTKVGKYPQAVILDWHYQDNAVRINANGSFTILDNKFGSWKDDYFDVSDISTKDIKSSFSIKESLDESIDWTELNATEQFAAESAISYIEDNPRIVNDLDEIELAVRDAVSMYNEANAFDEYADEDFYEEEADSRKVLKYVLQKLHGIDESLNEDLSVYPVEFTYDYEDDDKNETFFGHINVKANSEEEALKKAEKYVNSNEYGSKHIERNQFRDFRISSTKYTNVDLVEDVDDINAARMQLCQVLDDWYRDNIANERAEDVRKSGWDSDLQDKYLDFRNYLAPDLIQDKVEDDFVVDNIETEVDTLQEMLKQNQALEKQIINLQEKLSVSNAMEKDLKEELSKCKDKISVLSKSSKENKVLTEQLTAVKDSAAKTEKQLSESKQENNKKIKALTEKYNKLNEEKLIQENELVTLKEDYEVLDRDLTQTKEQFSKKFERQNQLLEKYQKITKNAVDRYINMQAVNLGVKPVEIKNRLSESFTFNDIDSVCENLREYKLNVSKLPFNTNRSLNEGMGIKANNFDNSLLPRNEIDELTDYDIKLMEAYL